MRVTFALLLALPFLGCQPAEKCNDWGGGMGTASWGACGDKKDRKVECNTSEWINTKNRAAPGSLVAAKCTCTVDGIVGKSFETTDPIKLGTKDAATAIANEQCGWHLK